jgi:hypothetical protein
MLWADGLVLVALLIAAPLLYLPVLRHNLPVAAGIDERNALEIVRRFHHGTLNPGFFQYPTMYFYLVYLLALPLQYSDTNVMLTGRLLDLMLIGLTAFVVYAFCRDRLHSRAAGAIAAALVLGSTEMSGIVYLHPDLLMAAAGTASLYYLVEYFETRGRRAWLLGLTLMGISIGCKYTAFLLYVAYAVMEIVTSLRDRRMAAGKRAVLARFPRRSCILTLLAIGGILLLASWLTPVQPLLARLLKARAVYQPGPGNYYVEVFAHLRRLLAEAGLLTLGLALACRYIRDVYESISIKRLYDGLGVILTISVVCTPYSLIGPAQFLFDLGSLTRSNIVVAGGHAQWAAYAEWLIHDEGIFAVLLGAAGLAMFAARANRRLQIVLVYLGIYLYVLGTSQIGYPRYLVPVIPWLSIGAGWAIVPLLQFKAKGSRATPFWNPQRVLALSLLAGAFIQTTANIVRTRQQAGATNSFFASYMAAKSRTTGIAFYAGYAPAVELEEAGVTTTGLSWQAIANAPLGQHLACEDTLILNTPQAVQNHVDARADSSVVVLADAPGPGQEAQQVLRKSGCP